MIGLYTPQYEDLWFRKMFMSDETTMSYNHAWGGIIDFPESDWADWYNYWVQNTKGERFYRYLKNENNEFVGEIAYHYNGKEYIANVIVYAKGSVKRIMKKRIPLSFGLVDYISL